MIDRIAEPVLAPTGMHDSKVGLTVSAFGAGNEDAAALRPTCRNGLLAAQAVLQQEDFRLFGKSRR